MSIAVRERLLEVEVAENELVEGRLNGDGIVRRTTDEALELITRSGTRTLSHSDWYKPGGDFRLYASAQDACRATNTRLKALDLQEEEFENINSASDGGLEALMRKIEESIASQSKPSKRHPVVKKAGHWVEVFSEFVTRTSGIIELLVPQSAEYRMTYGALLIVFTTVFKRRDTQDSLLEYFKRLSEQLPILSFYSKVFPSDGARKLVVSIYVEILNLLDEAIVYYHSGHLRQLRDAVLRPQVTKFDKCIERIEAEVQKLYELKDAAHVAQQADMQVFLESTGQVVGRLHENLNLCMSQFSSSLARLEARIENVALQSASVYNFQAFNHSLALTEVILPTASTADEQLSRVRKQPFNLSPKDHWYETDVLKAFGNWSAYGRGELLWISGRSGNQDTWITEMSIDLIDALQVPELTLLHVFCDVTNEAISPTTVLKRLVAQLLDRHPEIPFRQPKTYNVQRFRRATTFTRLWPIFESLVRELTSNVFILIDRIDDCDDPDADDGGSAVFTEHLLPFLMGLASEASHVSVIVTSEYEPPDELVEEDELRYFYQDTRKSRGKRER